VSCRACIVHDHLSNPFHRIEAWDGTHFSRVSLSELGLVINLNHRGSHCPHAITPIATHRFTVVDVNGIHPATIAYCHCANAPGRAVQLVRSGLYPSSTRRPQTAFTLRLLRDFHIDTVESHKTAYDYVGKLERWTNNTFPDEVEVRNLNTVPGPDHNFHS
jgi:hypothetical protein